MILKSLLTSLILATAFCYLSHNLRDVSAPSSMTIMPIIFILTLFLSAAFAVVGQRSHQLRSSVLFYFWTLTTLAALPTFLSSVRVALETDQGTYDHTKDQDFRVMKFCILSFSIAKKTYLLHDCRPCLES